MALNSSASSLELSKKRRADEGRLRRTQIADFSDIFTGRLISEIPQSLRSLCDSMLNLPALISVDFSDNAFGGRSAEPMSVSLSLSRAVFARSS